MNRLKPTGRNVINYIMQVRENAILKSWRKQMEIRDHITKALADKQPPMTRYRLAKLAGIQPQQVYAYLATGREMSLRNVEKIRRVLGLV